jgi:hypothetical protein
MLSPYFHFFALADAKYTLDITYLLCIPYDSGFYYYKIPPIPWSPLAPPEAGKLPLPNPESFRDSLVKRGKGRFSDTCLFNYKTLIIAIQGFN